MTLKNYGYSPANGARFLGGIYYEDATTSIDPRLSRPLLEERRFCGSLASGANKVIERGSTIFPDKTIEQPAILTASREYESAILKKETDFLQRFSPSATDQSLDTYIIGCIVYNGSTLGDAHLTPLILNISTRNSDGVILELDASKKNYPLDSLVITQHGFSDPPS